MWSILNLTQIIFNLILLHFKILSLFYYVFLYKKKISKRVFIISSKND